MILYGLIPINRGITPIVKGPLVVPHLAALNSALPFTRTSHLLRSWCEDLDLYGTDWDSTYALSTLAWGRMGGNAYICMNFQFQMVKVIFVITPPTIKT